MNDQRNLFDKEKGEVLIFGADGYKNIHHDITHCHKCWPSPQATLIERDNDLPGYRFQCRKCMSRWEQTDEYINGYNLAVEKIGKWLNDLEERRDDG